MIRRILITTAFFMLLLGAAAYAAETPATVQKKVTQSMEKEAKAQEQADNWVWDKQTAVDKIRDLKYRITWLQYRQEKNRTYISEVQKDLENLNFQKSEILKLREQLEPYLEDEITQLEAFIATDLPFLPAERAKRIASLRASMNNYEIPMSEKLRRVFNEGLLIEAEYGRMVEAIEDQTINVDGVDTQTMVFRLGRVLMAYMTLDGTKSGFYNKETKAWETLPSGMNRSIRRALDIAQRKRTAEPIVLPLGAVK